MDWVECNLVPTGDKDHEDLWKWLEWKQDKRLHASMNGKARLLTMYGSDKATMLGISQPHADADLAATIPG